MGAAVQCWQHRARVGAVSLCGNSRVPCHHITPHSRALQIAETFWSRSFMLYWLVNYCFFSKINSITALHAAAAAAAAAVGTVEQDFKILL